MQTLYVLLTLEQEVKAGEPLKLLQKHFDQSRELLVYLIYFFSEIAAYAEKDAHQRSSKHLPTAEDLNVNIKIAGNEVIWKIKEDATYQEQVKKEKPEQYLDKDLVRKFYHLLVETTEYKKYAATPSRTFKEEREIVHFLFEGGHVQPHAFDRAAAVILLDLLIELLRVHAESTLDGLHNRYMLVLDQIKVNAGFALLIMVEQIVDH